MAEVPYGITLATFLTGNTGMRLQRLGAPGKDALVLGWFLSANEWANMIGLYELSPTRLTRWLPSVKGKALVRAFDLLDKEQFAHYDEPTEFVWVREMARVRLALEPGVPANPKEKRIIGAQNLYQRLSLNPYLGPFYDRYHVELSLKHRRNADRSPTHARSNGDPSPNDRRSNTDGSGTDRCLVPPSTPSGTSTSGSAKQDQVPADQVPEKAAAAPPLARRFDKNDPTHRQATVETLTALLRKEIIPLLGQKASVADLKDAAACACGQMKPPMEWHPDDMRRAIDSALKREELRAS